MIKQSRVTTDSKIAALTKKKEDLITPGNDLYSEIRGLRKENENRAFSSKSLRMKTGRNPGGQKGQCCAKDIGTVPGEFVARSQEVDIPPIRPVITEHHDFPNGIKASIGYCPMIENLTGYFHARQYVPFLRMQEIFRDIFSVPVSQGGIHCLLNRLADKAQPWCQKIWEQVKHSSVVGSEETGVQTHQLCTACLLRELKYLEERYPQRWPIRYKDYILTFLYHPTMPPNSNGSEQAIPNVKVKQKVSGQFKSWKE